MSRMKAKAKQARNSERAPAPKPVETAPLKIEAADPNAQPLEPTPTPTATEPQRISLLRMHPRFWFAKANSPVRQAEAAEEVKARMAKRERFDGACRQVQSYFATPKVREYWLQQIEEVAASVDPTWAFSRGKLKWPADKATIYAVMAACAQPFTKMELIPEPILATEWYKLNRHVHSRVSDWDQAPVLLAYIEQDLKERGLLGGQASGASNVTTAEDTQTEPTPDAESKTRDEKPKEQIKTLPKDLIRFDVVISRYIVSRSTLQRAVKVGSLISYRGREKGPHLLSEAAVQGFYRNR